MSPTVSRLIETSRCPGATAAPWRELHLMWRSKQSLPLPMRALGEPLPLILEELTALAYRQTVILVDPDKGRAGSIAASLQRIGTVAVRLRDEEDLPGLLSGTAVILAADDGGALPGLFEWLQERGMAPQVIAYSSTASPHRIVKALSLGAADYLIWPCDASLIGAAIAASTAARRNANVGNLSRSC